MRNSICMMIATTEKNILCTHETRENENATKDERQTGKFFFNVIPDVVCLVFQ